MSEHKFGPGEYRMKDGEAVVSEVFGGEAFGRCTWGRRVAWAPSCWDANTGLCKSRIGDDLLPPEPPVVVSNEAVDAYYRAWSDALFGADRMDDTRAGLAAAYPIMVKDNMR